ncbi:hypothetical protein VTI74DRAFT_7285 [Chaetomium olivicolor]
MYVTDMQHGGPGQQTHPQHSRSQRAQAIPTETAYQRRQLHSRNAHSEGGFTKRDCAAPRAAPPPLFSDNASSLPATRPRVHVSPALPTAAKDNSLTMPRPPGGRDLPTRVNDGKDPVDMEQPVRMDVYRRGFCQWCRQLLSQNSLPMVCPYQDCKRDSDICLKYPNRVEAKEAPPRLAERPFLNIQPKRELTRFSQGIGHTGSSPAWRGSAISQIQRDAQEDDSNKTGAIQRKAVPSLTVEAPTPVEDHASNRGRSPRPPRSPISRRPKSSSPPNTVRTIWPSPLGIYEPSQLCQPPKSETDKYKEKPLPMPPTPPNRSAKRPAPLPSLVSVWASPILAPVPPVSASISERHRQLYTKSPRQDPSPRIHLHTPSSSLSSPPETPSPLCSSVSTDNTNSPLQLPSPSTSPRGSPSTSGYHGLPAFPPSRYRGLAATAEAEEEEARKLINTAAPITTTTTTTTTSPRPAAAPGVTLAAAAAASAGKLAPPGKRSPSENDDAPSRGWKASERRLNIERDALRARGDEADLFMDIIGEYDDDDSGGAGSDEDAGGGCI